MATVIQFDNKELLNGISALPIDQKAKDDVTAFLVLLGITYESDTNSIIELPTLGVPKDLRDKIGLPKFTIERVVPNGKTHRLTIHSTPSLVIDFDAKVPPRND